MEGREMFRFERYKNEVLEDNYENNEILEDYVIIEKMKHGDQSAIKNIVKKYRRLYIGIFEGYHLSEEDVKECENDILFALWNSVKANNPPNYLKAFIVKIARNRASSVLKKKKRKKEPLIIDDLELGENIDLPSSVDIEDIVITKEMAQAVASCVKTLPREDRIVFTLKYVRHMDLDAIKMYLGQDYSTVASRLRRLKLKIMRHLIKEGFLNEGENNRNEK